MSIRQLIDGEICQWDGCGRVAEGVYCGRTDHTEAGAYCETHGYEVADELYPEYHDTCPNCQCTFGVN